MCHSGDLRWPMPPETPKFPSLFSSISWVSSMSPDPAPPLRSWPPAARAWWTCPSGAEETETMAVLKKRGRGKWREHPVALRARSLEISKSQTYERKTRGNSWATPPGGWKWNGCCLTWTHPPPLCWIIKTCHWFVYRKSPLYDNCFLYAPDGEPLCTCDKKKAKWYLNRGIAGRAVTPCSSFYCKTLGECNFLVFFTHKKELCTLRIKE